MQLSLTGYGIRNTKYECVDAALEARALTRAEESGKVGKCGKPVRETETKTWPEPKKALDSQIFYAGRAGAETKDDAVTHRLMNGSLFIYLFADPRKRLASR